MENDKKTPHEERCIVQFDPDNQVSIWEKPVQPPPLVFDEIKHTMRSEQFDSVKPLTHGLINVAYGPPELVPLPECEQEITVYLGPPIFIMSPRIKIYRKEQIVRMKGFLSSFVPDGASEQGEPEATLTIEITEGPTVG